MIENDNRNSRKRGGQIGNQNARKHGFYSRVLDDSTRKYIDYSRRIDGLDEEIALVRAKIRAMTGNEKEMSGSNIYLHAMDTLTRMVKTRNNLNKSANEDLKNGLTNIIRDIGLPLGIDLNDTLFK